MELIKILKAIAPPQNTPPKVDQGESYNSAAIDALYQDEVGPDFA